jgi:hypothetical protein
MPRLGLNNRAEAGQPRTEHAQAWLLCGRGDRRVVGTGRVQYGRVDVVHGRVGYQVLDQWRSASLTSSQLLAAQRTISPPRRHRRSSHSCARQQKGRRRFTIARMNQDIMRSGARPAGTCSRSPRFIAPPIMRHLRSEANQR